MKRVFVLGIDGLCQPVWERLAAGGLAPQLTQVIRRTLPLRSTTPPHSAPAWTSIATGLNPGRHGVLDFWWRASNTPASWRSRPLVTSSGKMNFWEMASLQGFPVGVFNYPLSYPPRTVNCYWVCGLNTPTRVDDFVYPATLAGRLQNFKADLDVVALSKPHKGQLRSDERREAVQDVIALAQNHFDAGSEVLAATADQDIALHLFVITATDRFMHLFWDVMQADNGPLVDEAAQFWRTIDQGVGRWLDLARPDAVILVSDHGFAASPRMAFNISRWLEMAGWAPRREERRGRAGLVNRLGRSATLKALAKRILPGRQWRAMQQEQEADALAFYAQQSPVIPEVLYGRTLGLTLNVKGRQAQGILTPEEAAGLTETILLEAQALRGDDGRPVFRSAQRSSDVWWGEHLEHFPDLVLDLEDDYGGSVGSLDSRLALPVQPARTGDHQHEAMLGLSELGDLPAATAESTPAVWDVAGIALHLLGAEIPDQLDSRPPAWLPGVVRRSNMPLDLQEASQWFSSKDADAIENRLRQLGYVE